MLLWICILHLDDCFPLWVCDLNFLCFIKIRNLRKNYLFGYLLRIIQMWHSIKHRYTYIYVPVTPRYIEGLSKFSLIFYKAAFHVRVYLSINTLLQLFCSVKSLSIMGHCFQIQLFLLYQLLRLAPPHHSILHVCVAFLRYTLLHINYLINFKLTQR